MAAVRYATQAPPVMSRQASSEFKRVLCGCLTSWSHGENRVHWEAKAKWDSEIA